VLGWWPQHPVTQDKLEYQAHNLISYFGIEQEVITPRSLSMAYPPPGVTDTTPATHKPATPLRDVVQAPPPFYPTLCRFVEELHLPPSLGLFIHHIFQGTLVAPCIVMRAQALAHKPANGSRPAPTSPPIYISSRE
jgi:hypothetical protein